ncbi:MAG TPA: HD family phosphohydrolase [Actinobacteria bacterium]|nr:HD family phosphohydrolase [Actinomycetota bacterium]
MIEKVIEKMIFYFEKDRKMINHTLKVFGFASTIGRLEGLPEEKQLTLELSSILHDIGIKISREKYNSSDAQYQEKEGPAIVKSMLEPLGFSKDIIDRVSFIVGSHHSYEKIDEADFRIVVEADFLVNLDEGFVPMSDLDMLRKQYFKTKSSITILDSMYKN